MRIKLNTLLLPALLCLALFALVGIAADLLKVLPQAPEYPQRDSAKAPRWNIVEVLGPDRLIIGNADRQRTVKLLGVAEPQSQRPKDRPAAHHLLAVDFLNNLLVGEEVLILDPQRSPNDPESLDVVKLFRAPDGLYVNLEMIRQGYARLSPAGLAHELPLFSTYQERARLAGKGLWNESLSLVPVLALPTGKTVYVTKTGKKYHRKDCQFLSKSRVPLALDEAKNRGFTPCRICKPPQ